MGWNSRICGHNPDRPPGSLYVPERGAASASGCADAACPGPGSGRKSAGWALYFCGRPSAHGAWVSGGYNGILAAFARNKTPCQAAFAQGAQKTDRQGAFYLLLEAVEKLPSTILGVFAQAPLLSRILLSLPYVLPDIPENAGLVKGRDQQEGYRADNEPQEAEQLQSDIHRHQGRQRL